MSTRLSEVSLRHVDPAKLLFQARHPAFPANVETPEWYENAKDGGVNLAPWLRGTVLAVMETKFQRDAYFIVVSVMGLYMSDEQAAAQQAEFSNQVDSSTLDEASEQEQLEFAERVVADLFPFLRVELYNLSGRMQGINGIMLQPHPEINQRQ